MENREKILTWLKSLGKSVRIDSTKMGTNYNYYLINNKQN